MHERLALGIIPWLKYSSTVHSGYARSIYAKALRAQEYSQAFLSLYQALRRVPNARSMGVHGPVLVEHYISVFLVVFVARAGATCLHLKLNLGRNLPIAYISVAYRLPSIGFGELGTLRTGRPEDTEVSPRQLRTEDPWGNRPRRPCGKLVLMKRLRPT